MWPLVRAWHTLPLLILTCILSGFATAANYAQDFLSYPYPYVFRTDPEWPCGAGQNNFGRSEMTINPFFLEAFTTANDTKLSLLMTTGDWQTGSFTTILHPTVYMPAWGAISWLINLQPLGLTYGQNATIQMIFNNGTTTYACADVLFNQSFPISEQISGRQLNSSDYSSNGVLLLWDTTNTVEFASDDRLANGSYPLNGSLIVTNSSASYSVYSSTPTPSSSSSSSSSSGLSTGAKVAIGVVVPVVAIALGLAILFFLRRRRSANLSATLDSPTFTAASEKPELQGAGYDPAIAGSVKSKSELATQGSRMSTNPNLPPQETFRELPSPEISSNILRTHSDDAYLPAELGLSPVSHELAQPRAPHLSTQNPNRLPHAAPTTASSATAIASPDPGQHDEALASEADLLVQELGLINMRKKILASTANAPGISPENLPGQKGEDYRELVQREAKLRTRIEEMNSRSGNG